LRWLIAVVACRDRGEDVTTDQQIRAAITQRAADWFVANRAGPLGDGERAAFFAWLKASPIHVEEYLGVAKLERGLTAATDDPSMTLDALLEMARQDQSGHVVDLIPATETHSARGRTWSRRAGWGVAAVITLTVGALWMQSTMRDGQWLGLPKTYQTAHGAQAAWHLADGSVLHLNTDSAVTVRYSSTERLLTLDRGEAMFEVAHDTRRAFRVLADSTSAVAVGTQFDAYRRPDSTQITVIAGQIAVFDGKAAPAIPASAAAPSVLRVSAGQQVRVIAGVLPAAPTNINLGEVMAWLQRKIVFDQRPLGEVADEFNRYNTIQFSIDDAALRAMRIGGVFDAADTESFAAYLESLEGVRVQRRAALIQVSRSQGSPH
jgi:transmembrane sensor